MEMKGETLVGCLKYEGLYGLCCMVLQRLAKGKIKATVNKDSVVEIVKGLHQGMKGNKGNNIGAMVDALVELLNVYGEFNI